MDALSFPEQLIPGFQLRVLQDEASVTLECSGTLETEDTAVTLGPALLELHRRLIASGVKSVRLSLMALTYVNSGGIKAFASWFTRTENGGSPPYIIEVHHDPASTWQGSSLGVLQRLAPSAVRLVPQRRW
jgi:hypothetical protein